mgnify:CR=1 FL=1
MSMGSIDAVTMAPRTLNAADAQGRELNQNQHIYDQNGIQFQQQVRRESRQTVETQESETKDYDKKGNGKGTGAKNSSKKKQKQETLVRMRNLAQLDEGFFAHMKDGKDMFDATAREIRNTYQQLGAGITQIQENIKEASQMAADNGEKEQELTGQLASYQEQEVQSSEKREQMLQNFAQIEQEMAQLVEENKHFTTPSKFLNEFPVALKAENEKTREELEKMQDCGKQMGVLALNAAIEAGRMGEGGKQFVTAAETIRVSAGTYDELIDQAHKRLADSDERIAELEEQVHRMVTLLKENNVAMTKLMKSCQEAARQAQEWNRLKPCPNFKEMENQIVVLRNADEEIAKSEERNRMQMEDFTEEMESQKKNFDELLQSMETVYRHAAERKK